MSDPSQSDSLFIQPDWIKLLIRASEREVADLIGLKPVTEEVRSVVWNMANTLGFRSDGVPGRACQLLERYFFFLFRSYRKNLSREERTTILESVKSRLMLIIASCIVISAKMHSAETYINLNLLRVFLLCKGVYCTTSEIIRTEVEVYAMLGFWVPLWTSVEIGEQLAHEIEISSTRIPAVAMILDMVDYLKNVIEEKMQCVATGSSAITNGVSTLHLSAAAVVVAARLEPIYSKKEITITMSATEPASAKHVERLARLVSAPIPYLTCLADIIYTTISLKHQSKCSPLFLKRKRTN